MSTSQTNLTFKNSWMACCEEYQMTLIHSILWNFSLKYNQELISTQQCTSEWENSHDQRWGSESSPKRLTCWQAGCLDSWLALPSQHPTSVFIFCSSKKFWEPNQSMKTNWAQLKVKWRFEQSQIPIRQVYHHTRMRSALMKGRIIVSAEPQLYTVL